MAIDRIPLSGSTHGLGVKIAATATAGTTIHTATSGSSGGLGDEIHLWAYNEDTVGRVLTIEWGGVSTPDDIRRFDIPARMMVPIIPGFWLRNSLVVAGFCAGAANVIIVDGFVNRVT